MQPRDDVYHCELWRDPGAFRRLRSTVFVESFDTALDLNDPLSLEHALAAAAHRDRSDPDLELYRLDVSELGSPEAILMYRHTPWVHEDEDDY
jgi:hypothetical protein